MAKAKASLFSKVFVFTTSLLVSSVNLSERSRSIILNFGCSRRFCSGGDDDNSGERPAVDGAHRRSDELDELGELSGFEMTPLAHGQAQRIKRELADRGAAQ